MLILFQILLKGSVTLTLSELIPESN